MKKQKENKKKKKTTLGDVVRNIILLIAVGIFLFSGYKLLNIYMEYRKGTEEYDKIREYVKHPEKQEPEESKENPAAEPSEEKPQPPAVDFAALQAINPDVIGWLQMETLDISYPIVKGTDNDYYLHYTFEKQKNAAGSIFMNYTNNSSFEDCNTIIYGHNMKNGSMFGTFKNLHDEANFTSPYIWVCTPEKSYRYEIFSIHNTSASGETYTLFSAPDEQFQQYLKSMKSLSDISLAAEVTKDDKIITLSTCTGDDATRFVIQAKRLPEVY